MNTSEPNNAFGPKPVFDPTKPYQQRNGRAAKILTTESRASWNSTYFPIVADCEQREGFYRTLTFQESGLISIDNRESPDDLINIPAPPKWRAWNSVIEIPFGAIIRVKGAKFWHAISAFDEELCKIYAGVSFSGSCDFALNKCEYSTDGGRSVHTCGIQEPSV